MEQCQILREYAIYVARVRKYAKYMQLETAVQKAVDECIQEEILEEFLRKNRAEVIAVSIFEYDKEEEERKLRKAEFEAGEQSGIQKGIQKGIQEGIQKGKELKTCASHSRYFSDELDALFFKNKQNKCLQTILAYGIIKTWRKICLISMIMNFHMVEDMCIPCSTIWYGVQNTGKRF